jgi:hypothetical protein
VLRVGMLKEALECSEWVCSRRLWGAPSGYAQGGFGVLRVGMLKEALECSEWVCSRRLWSAPSGYAQGGFA